MSPARRLALRLSRISFRLLLVIVITAIAFLITFGTSQQIKSNLKAANAYEQFVPSLIEANIRQSDEPSLFVDKNVQKLVLTNFTPDMMEDAATRVIDGTYSWLSGAVSEPAFIVDFRLQREKLAEQLSVYAMEKLAVLPVCTGFDASGTLDPFMATCQPPNIDYQAEQQALFAQLVTSDDFIPDVMFTQADLPKANTGETIAEAYPFVPFVFGMAWPITIVLALLLLLSALTILMLRPVVRSGWRELGRMLIINGGILALSGLVFGLLIPRFSRSMQDQFINNGTERLFGDVIQGLSISFQTVFINISLLVAVLGLLIIVGLKAFPQRSRYEGLEKVTGITNGIRPKLTPLAGQKAAHAPIVTSEHRTVRRNTSKSKKHVTKEVA